MYYVIYFDDVWKIVCDSLGKPLLFPNVERANNWIEGKPEPEEHNGYRFMVLETKEVS